MRKLIRSTTLLLSLVAVVILGAACMPPATAVPPTSAPTTSNSIQNIVWQWTSVSSRPSGETTSIPDPGSYTVVFYPDGRVSGAADCNTFTGAYSQASGFSITLGATTMAACGDDSLDTQYLALLGAVAAGGPDGAGGLALETAGGEQRMQFQNGGPATQ